MNEAVFFFATLCDLLFILFAWRLGKDWLYFAILLNICLCFFLLPKFYTFFGFTVSMSSIAYMAIYTGTDILTEHEGKQAGYKVAMIGFMAAFFLVLMQQLTLIPAPIADSGPAHEAMSLLFEMGPRLFVAWVVSYFIAQRLDVWLYHFFKRQTGGRYLWFRNNASTAIALFVDSVIFCLVAFSFIMPWATLIQVFIGAYVINMLSALLDTPVLYLSYLVKGKKLSEIKT